MTDPELLSRAVGIFDPNAKRIGGLRRGGRLLLALPDGKEAFARALRLYQPQRPAARMMVAALEVMSRFRLYGALLSSLNPKPASLNISPALPDIEPGTCGILLGSPEHRVRRAIASYRNEGQWEVAKISFEKEGAHLLKEEAAALEGLGKLAVGVPRLLGLHRAGDATVMRMDYLSGKRIASGESGQALKLLDSWITDLAPVPIRSFPEWPAIEKALLETKNSEKVLGLLCDEKLCTVICHGDFARWNLLKQPDGSLMALDWEWGHAGGMPGIDLVHYFLQDARLVERLKPSEAIRSTIGKLGSSTCQAYLAKTGWSGDPILPIIACLAYKQGAMHQANGEVLEAALLV